MVSEETGTVTSGSSSLKYQIVSGYRSWVNIQHAWSPYQDWSCHNELAFYWYGTNSGKKFSVIIEASTWADRFTASFVDDFDGWQKVTMPLSGFSTVGSPSWSNVRKLYIAYSGTTSTSWYIDKTSVEAP